MRFKEKKRIFVIGSRGQLGSQLVHHLPFAFPSADIFFSDRTSLDLNDLLRVKNVVKEFSPHVIINAAAYTNVDEAEDEEDKAKIINAEIPGVLAEISLKNEALLIHYSTDYVFDGLKKDPYHEDDIPNPLNIYGKSKLEGEKNIVCINGNFLILRTSWVHADKGINFLRTVLRLASEKKELSIVNDQNGCPTSACWLAETTSHLSKKFLGENAFEKGIYHAVCSGGVSRFEYARFILECAKIDDVRLIPVSSDMFPTKAKRPGNTCLSVDKIKKKLEISPPSWENEVRRTLSLLMKGE